MATAYQRRRKHRPGRKLLGLDIGERRVGVAVSDDTGVIASPLRIVDVVREGTGALAALASEQRVEGVVVGLPTSMSGQDGYQAREVRAAAAELAQMIDVPILFWDERLTSAIADRMLERSGVRQRDRRGKLDAIAAAVMLQSYLDAHPWRDPPESGSGS
jgi:putative Holliday junction resolvase